MNFLKDVKIKSNIMTLDEAIKHCEEISNGCDKCADEHRQLADWLKELKNYRQNILK